MLTPSGYRETILDKLVTLLASLLKWFERLVLRQNANQPLAPQTIIAEKTAAQAEEGREAQKAKRGRRR